ncbi:MAG: 50S ribosomal protein L21 [Myxococcota bacterium]|jgi:large subunit ribosomal protein L21|nr:50S ribosomal protein L21 [Myxococcota bacterium]
MYAVVEQGGKQYRVSEGDTLEIDRLEAEEGAEIELSRVLLIGGDKVKVGSPAVKGAKVTAKVVSHYLGDKVETFKYRPRKRYRKLGGFRASVTKIEITGIKA